MEGKVEAEILDALANLSTGGQQLYPQGSPSTVTRSTESTEMAAIGKLRSATVCPFLFQAPTVIVVLVYFYQHSLPAPTARRAGQSLYCTSSTPNHGSSEAGSQQAEARDTRTQLVAVRDLQLKHARHDTQPTRRRANAE
jgi:hypothetical protein